MWGNRVVLFILCSILGFVHSFGQYKNIEFDHYTTDDGLTNGYVQSILQDSKGFIWIGTINGLNRFDGITFKTYYFDPKDSTSIPGNGTNSLLEDSVGNIWILTSNGLCVHDRKKDNFSTKTINVNGNRLTNLYFNTGFIDSDGFLWLAVSNTGILKLKNYDNPQIFTNSIEAEFYALDEDDVDKVYKNNVYSINEDKQGTIWCVSYSKELFYFDKLQNRFIPRPILHREANRLSNNRKGMIIDRVGDFFVSIENVGFLHWSGNDNQFNLYCPNGTDAAPVGSVLFSMCEDKNGLIWIGDRDAKGISIFNKETKKFTFCPAEELNPYSIETNKINCIYEDKNGSIWIGTIIGLEKFSPGKSKFTRYYSNPIHPYTLSLNNTLCFTESKTGDIWIGTDGGGLNKFNRETKKFVHYLHDPSNPNSISSNSIISICEDHEGTLWMGTFNGGLAKMKNNKFSAYYPNDNNPYSISNINIWYVLEDSKENLWVATLNSGLHLFDRATNRFYNYTNESEDSTSLCSNSIIELYENSKQQLYITTYAGISIIELGDYDFSNLPPNLKFRNLQHNDNRNSISSNEVYCVKEDNKGNMWFGTIATGIDKYDCTTGKFTNYSTKDGLPGNSVSSILTDSLNNLWLATDNGLVKFNPQTEEIVAFDQKDGLQNRSLKSWALKTKDGEMFFGGPNGFNSFYPEKIKYHENLHKPPVVITQLKIFNQPVAINELINNRVILSNAISETQELILTYKENYFTLEFIALDYTAPEKNKYAYKMEGFDKDWVHCGNRREANYTNLDPGNYTFKVIASNNDNVWNEDGTALKIVILPPWWKTWLFRSIIILALIVLLVSIFIIRVQQFKNQKILLEKLVAEKTSELQSLNSTLLKQAAELNHTNILLEERKEEIEKQKESLIEMNQELNELNATKDKFFSIIAHDIKTPFNAIVGFSSLLNENFFEWTDEMKLKSIDRIYKSSKNLYQLLENLLQWSRSQRGKIEFQPESIQLSEVFKDITELMKGIAEAKNIELTVKLNQELTVYADRQMLNAILRNLVSNAIKFTNIDGKVQISANKVDEFVKIKIIDNGIGIRYNIKNQLFKLETSQSTPGTNNESGTGLGLILTKDFVTKNGGKIGLDSTFGKGSTFYFTLPLANHF